MANPADTNAAPNVSVPLGVKAMLDTTPTTVSFATSFNILRLTPVLSSGDSVTTCVTPDPALVVGPISVHADPVYT